MEEIILKELELSKKYVVQNINNEIYGLNKKRDGYIEACDMVESLILQLKKQVKKGE
jgi:hypothetical protein